MIGYLQGIVKDVQDQGILLLVNGIGYEVSVLQSVISRMQVGEEVELFTYFHVREDVQALYGFSTLEEKDFFKRLIAINGIGPKMAMTALNAAPVQEIVKAVLLDDHGVFTSVSGIGAKKAKRLVLELKPQLDGLEFSTSSITSGQIRTVRGDLIEALEQLGYRRDEISGIIAEIDDSLELSDALKEALKKIAK